VRLLKPIIATTWEAEIGRIIFPSQPGQNAHEIPSQPRAGRGGAHLLSQVSGKHKQEDFSLGHPGRKVRPYLKNSQGKKG
jgi:hypothetical protein